MDLETFYWRAGLFFVVYFAAVNFIYMFLLIIGAFSTFKRYREQAIEDFTSIFQSDSLPGISFIIAAYNEEKHILRCVRNVINLSYPKKEIIVVNDGSTDKTLDILKDALGLRQVPLFFERIFQTASIRGIYKSRLYPEVIVLDKENGRKYDAVNAGLALCSSDMFITVDADTFLDDHEFDTVIRPIFQYPDVVALGASVRTSNSCFLSYHSISTERFPHSYLDSMQTLEYLRSFLMRQGWDYTGGNYCVSGAFAVLSKHAVIKAGGFAPTIANDLELIVRLHRVYRNEHLPYRISYLSDPVAWTYGPANLKRLGEQRRQWHMGLMESLWFHRRMFFNPKYGAFGLFVLPVALFGELLEPLVEIAGYIFILAGILLGIVDLWLLIIFILVSWGITMVFSFFCLAIEELSFRKYKRIKSVWKLFLYSLIENFGYRQLTLIWRVNGFISFLKRFKSIKKNSKIVNEKVEAAAWEVAK